MIHIPFVNTINDKTPRESKTCDKFHRLLIYPVGHEVFCQCTIITVSYFILCSSCLILNWLSSLIVKILNINKVDVSICISIVWISPRNKPTKNFLPKKSGADFQIMLLILIVFSIAKSFFNVYNPRMVQHLRNADSFFRFQNYHFSDQIFNLVADRVNREIKVSSQD